MGGSLIVGMAGHIDHGKSALVTALTGAPMDRLAEERRRGITIDLNFAPLALEDGGVAGVIDVPGHEDFVRTMVAGASGVDLALLVIAADEGIMPQTLEHLAVLEHLRVPAGIPVITKADLASKEDLESLSTGIEDRLTTSIVRFERPVVTSVRSGEGLGELKTRIAASAGRVAWRISSDYFRLPIDRAFSVPGVGTVLTGTAWSGTIAVGDEVLILPGTLRGRVRSIESHGRSLQRSEPRARTAVGLAGVDRSAIDRGGVVVAQGDPWQVTTAFDAELTVHVNAPRPIGTRTRIR
ncbi:MAG: selenocysteine-specific translation elongation factor, partial [Gemmatimonadales bacterium]